LTITNSGSILKTAPWERFIKTFELEEFIMKIVSIIILAVGLFEIYATVKAFKELKIYADKNTSPFMPIALYSGISIGVVLTISGLSTLFM